ncbi:MAG: reprolysin-like metallopeptidase [Planctomycetota bacterium]
MGVLLAAGATVADEPARSIGEASIRALDDGALAVVHAGMRVRLPGAPGVERVGRVRTIHEALPGGLSIIGSVEDGAGWFIATAGRGGTLALTMWMGDRTTTMVRDVHGAWSRTVDQDAKAPGMCGVCAHEMCAANAPTPELAVGAHQAVTGPGSPGAGDVNQSPLTVASETEPPVITLLVGYTPPAEVAAGSASAIEALIGSAVALTNESLANSGIEATVELLAIAPTEYVDSGDPVLDRNRLRDVSDGYADELPALRDVYQADLVAMIIGPTSTQTLPPDQRLCGVAFIGPDAPENGYSVTAVDCAVAQLTFPHELGHNLGSLHDFPNSGLSEAAAEGRFEFGRSFVGNDLQTYRTVMSVGQGLRVPYFSNPAVTYLGAPTGVAGTGPGSANNAAAIEINAPPVAAFRTGEPDFTDCDDNGMFDRAEISLNPSLDCNADDLVDACQITSGELDDCDGGGVPDVCEFPPPVLRSGPVRTGVVTTSYTDQFLSLPAARDGSIVTVAVIGGFDDPNTSVHVMVNGVGVGTVFEDGAPCDGGEQFASIELPAEVVNAGGGDVVVVTTVVGEPGAGCDPGGLGATLGVGLELLPLAPTVDSDGNGVIDVCERCPGDTNGDLVVDAFDFLTVLVRFGQSGPGIGVEQGDFDGDGDVDARDFLECVVAFGGSCINAD